jgi:hypothetical protein
MEQKSVVIKQQDQIEIYENEDGGITIKQTAWPNEDQVIYFSVEHAEIIFMAIEQTRKSIMAGE